MALTGRSALELYAMSFLEIVVRVTVMRFPPSVHGRGDHGFVPRLIDIARSKGVSAFPGDGANRWPAVHRLDAAQLFRLAVESGAGRAPVHGVRDEGGAVRESRASIWPPLH